MLVSVPSDQEIATRIGAWIRTIRKARRLTLKELSANTGAAVSALSDIERGVSLPSIGRLCVIAAGLGVKASQLMEAVYAD